MSDLLLLRSAKGRPLMHDKDGHEVAVVTEAREPSFRYRTDDGALSLFVAQEQEPGGTWVYRRVGVEREV